MLRGDHSHALDLGAWCDFWLLAGTGRSCLLEGCRTGYTSTLRAEAPATASLSSSLGRLNKLWFREARSLLKATQQADDTVTSTEGSPAHGALLLSPLKCPVSSQELQDEVR